MFMLFFKRKDVSFFYLSLQISVALFLVEHRWPAAYFLLLYIPNGNLSKLNTDFRQNGYRNNFCFPFSSLLTLKLSLFYKTQVAMRFPAKITLNCIWVAIPVFELFYIGLPVVRTDDRAGGRTVT